MKISATIIGAVLLGATLSACTGGDGGDTGAAGGSYCKDIAAAQPIFESLASGDLTQLEKGFTTFHELADESPDELKDAWKTLDDAATTVEDAIKDAGLKFDDLAGLQEGKIPAGVDMTKVTSFAAELQKLNNDQFSEARDQISQQAKDSCDVTLGAS